MVLAVIPARLQSTRFPGKVLAHYQGKPVLWHIYHELLKAKTIDRLVIASADPKILCEAASFGAEVAKTSARHVTGSDRVAEVCQKIGGDIIVNIQADSLGIKARTVDKAVMLFKRDRVAPFGTIANKIDDEDSLFNPDRVKVIFDVSGLALWFSRYPLPYLQAFEGGSRQQSFPFWHHIGVYLFKRKGLLQFSKWPRGRFEKAESLEQLRILEHHGKMRVYKTSDEMVSVDSHADLEKLNTVYR